MPVLAVFDSDGSWRDTHVCDGWITDRLAAHGVRWGREDAVEDGARALDRATLFYVPEGDGFLGLLFEEGEWVALPAGLRHFCDDGETGASLDALPAVLPRFEAFVEEVLALTGNAADED